MVDRKCLAIAERDGRTLVCGKSPSHRNSTDPQRREHYDSSADERWTDKPKEG